MTRPCRVLALGLLLSAGGAEAQPISDLFQFRISNPGARSLGFGGAFAALADDATAAYSNPAGLVQLVDPEFSFELRITDFSIGTNAALQVSGLGFLSFVYPRKRWSAAVYEASLARTEAMFGFPQVSFDNLSPSNASSTLDVETRGLAVAYRWSDNLSLGLGIARFDGDFNATSLGLESDIPPGAPGLFLSVSTVDATDVSANAGFLWHLPGGWDFGGFFRQGPSFVLESRTIRGFPTTGDGSVLAVDPEIRFDLADVFGLGVAYQSPGGSLTVSFEWDRVTSAGGLSAGDELHLGVEFLVLRTSPVIALRLGAWQDPDRRRGAADPRFLPLTPDGDDEIHLAAGFGFAFKNLKIDFAFDDSDPVQTGSFSLVYAF